MVRLQPLLERIGNRSVPFTGPDGRPWCAWRDQGSYNLQPDPQDDETDDDLPVFVLDYQGAGWWSIEVLGPFDEGSSIIVPWVLDAVQNEVDLSTPEKALVFGWNCWTRYLGCQRTCPFCQRIWDTPLKQLDGTLPDHDIGETRCPGSGASVEGLIGDNHYPTINAAELLRSAA